jgi:hypothetical protein
MRNINGTTTTTAALQEQKAFHTIEYQMRHQKAFDPMWRAFRNAFE